MKAIRNTEIAKKMTVRCVGVPRRQGSQAAALADGGVKDIHCE